MSELVNRYEAVLAPVFTYDSDIEVVAAEGAWVTDAEGETYLDFACGISVNNLGHRHPHVVEAVKAQIDQVWHAGGVFRYESIVAAAEALADVTPPRIDRFFFMNSGAEAVEAAVKMARKVTGRQGVMVFRGGFHGRTMGSVAYTTSKAKYRQGYHPLLPSVFVAPFPHPFSWDMGYDEAVDLCIDELDRILRHVITPGEVGSFLVEPIQGEGGYYPAGERFLRHLRDVTSEHGIVLIHDEIQTGFGRSGEWWTSDVYGVEPDVMCFGKAIANGLPLSAVGGASDLIDQWPPGSHGTTFGGNPVSAAAARATIEALADVIPGVPELSEHAFSSLRSLAERHPTIGEVRGMGLMIGVELVNEEGDPNPSGFDHVQSFAADNGLLVLSCGPDQNVMRVLPPLLVTTQELDQGIDIIDSALTSYEAR